jgi:hypothetical protein
MLAGISQSAPTALAATAAAVATGAVSASAGALVKGAIIMAAISKTKSLIGAAVVILLLCGSAALLLHFSLPPAPQNQSVATTRGPAPATTIIPPAPAISAPPFPHTDPAYASFPYAKGFPIALPGSITGSPAIADLDGDGKLEIVIPVIGRVAKDINRYDAAVHPNPSLAGQIFAFRADGSPYPNFPVVIRDLSFRAQRERLDWTWNFSPTVTDVDHNKSHELVVGHRVLYGDGMLLIYADLQDNYGSPPVADIDKDGDMDIVMGWFAASTRGAPIRGWPQGKNFFPGLCPAIGDVDGDGDLEIFHPHSTKIFGAYDHLARPLPGWPRPMNDRTMYPVLGDMDGDGKAEIAVMDEGNRLHIWHHDGRPVAASKNLSGMNGVFKDGMYAWFTHPAMADLDGDGKAEILILDWTSKSVRAWKIDGTPAVPHDPSLPDGYLFPIPPQKNSGYGASGGISVADLGGDGIIDIFVGTSWFKLPKSGPATRIDLTPAHPQSTTVPTIIDLDRDGAAEIVFGTTDGRLFVYHTKLAYESEWIEWQTQEANFQHTAMWRPPNQR